MATPADPSLVWRWCAPPRWCSSAYIRRAGVAAWTPCNPPCTRASRHICTGFWTECGSKFTPSFGRIWRWRRRCRECQILGEVTHLEGDRDTQLYYNCDVQTLSNETKCIYLWFIIFKLLLVLLGWCWSRLRTHKRKVPGSNSGYGWSMYISNDNDLWEYLNIVLNVRMSPHHWTNTKILAIFFWIFRVHVRYVLWFK